MKRYSDENLQIHAITDALIAVEKQMIADQDKYGFFNSHHEVYGVLTEEMAEYLDSVRNKDPDPRELLQIAAVALNAYLWQSYQARHELASRS